MYKNIITVSTLILFLSTVAYAGDKNNNSDLRAEYAKKPEFWPTAITADNKSPAELGPLLPLNPLANKQQIALGEKLFHDPILSRDKTISCASCHEKNKMFSDGKATGVGIDNLVGTRNTPAIIGLDHWDSFFWDGRSKTAEEQALQPIQNPIEMDLSIDQALERLNTDKKYIRLFNQAYGVNEIKNQDLANALVAFERSIDVPDTLFQRYIAKAYKQPKEALDMLTDEQLKGMHLFRTKAKCMTCHEGPLMSDNEFHITGFHFYGRRGQDLGRYDFTKKVEDSGKFRTPSLLGVTHTAPWMHTGLFVEFKPMIDQYNKGGFRPRRLAKFKDDPMFPETSPLVHKLHLTDQELDALVSFLHIL